MIGLCYSLQKDSIKDVETFWDSAISTYLDQRCIDHAIKTAILFYDVFNEAGRWREAVKLLIRISFEFSVTKSSKIHN